jgi:hypothetical protein
MPHGCVTDVIPAPAADVFRLLHDYSRRLEWDTLLTQAELLENASTAALGVKSICRGKSRLGSIALVTEYTMFRPPHIAAVKMLNHPVFFDSFAASIRHSDLSDSTSTIEYSYTFTARPRWLRPVLSPIMNWAFAKETKKRLTSLKRHFSIENRR